MASPTGEAKRKLAELGKQIGDAAKEVGRLQAEETSLRSANEILRSDNVNLTIEKENLEKDIEARRIELTELERVKKETRDGTNTLSDEAAAHRRAAVDASKEESETIARIASLKVSEIEAEKSLAGRQAIVVETEAEVRRLTGIKVELDQEETAQRAVLSKLEGRHARTEAAIDAALREFRVFERRIGQFSQETGFILAYDDPEELADNT